MPVLREGRVKLYPEEGAFLTYVQMAEFPWFFNQITEHHVGMVHALMHRPEDKGIVDEKGYLLPGKTPCRGIENSPHLPAAEQLFLRICGDNNITVRTVYRAAFNRTFHEPDAYCTIHRDHMFPHKVFILYIYARDGGDTLLFDSNLNLTDRIKAEEGKFVVFGPDNHAMEFCKPRSSRLIFIVTFDGDVNE